MVPLEEREPKWFQNVEPFSKKGWKKCPSIKSGTILAPLGSHFTTKKGLKWLPWGTEIVPPCKRELFFRKRLPFLWKALFWCPCGSVFYGKCTEKQCPFGKWHQNGVPKGPILQTVKRCPKGAVSVPLIFLSVACIFMISAGRTSCLPVSPGVWLSCVGYSGYRWGAVSSST